jgi:putative transposase
MPTTTPWPRVFASLETELLDRTRFRTRADARLAVCDYIEGFYNPQRLHSGLGYLSPAESEREVPLVNAVA